MATDNGITVLIGGFKQSLDTDTKEIGDWVKVIESTSFTTMDKQNISPYDHNLEPKLMVIEAGILSEIAYNEHLSFNQDLIVVNPETKIKFRVSSNHVKLVK